jgi:RimJ/RimL family protein N-acetyltransferase
MPEMAGQFRTARRDLRRFEDSDADELHKIFSDPATQTIGDGPITDFALTREWIRHRHQRQQEHDVVWYSLRLLGTGTMIGNAALFMGRTAPHPELGFEIRLKYQRRG